MADSFSSCLSSLSSLYSAVATLTCTCRMVRLKYSESRNDDTIKYMKMATIQLRITLVLMGLRLLNFMTRTYNGAL